VNSSLDAEKQIQQATKAKINLSISITYVNYRRR